MRYLSLLLVGPWLLVLAWAYWAAGRRARVSWQRKAYDTVVILIAFVAAWACAWVAYDDVSIQNVGDFGRESGGIWKQVMPALYGYGAFVTAIIAGIVARWTLQRWKRHRASSI